MVEDLSYVASLDSLSARWSGFDDVPSGIALYRWAIGTSPGGTDLFNYRVVSGATSKSIEGLSLQNGQKYFVSVKAVDRAGNSVVATSNGVVVDVTPPKLGTIVIDAFNTPDASGTFYVVRSLESLRVSWSGYEDAESGISTYAVGLGSGGCSTDDLLPLHDVGRRKAWTLDEDIPPQSTARVLLRSWNNAGFYTDSCSAPIRIDDTAPTAGVVYDVGHGPRTGEDADYQSSCVQIAAAWDSFSDAESGIVRYEWAVGSGRRPSQQVMAFVDVGLSTDASCVTGGCLQLEDGVTYFVTVRAFNGVDLFVEVLSNGVMVDRVPPTAGSVWDGSMPGDVSYQASLDVLSARWSGFEDVPSGVVQYRFGIGTVPGSDDVRGFAAVPSATMLNVLELQNVTAFAHQRATAMQKAALQLEIATTAASAADAAAAVLRGNALSCAAARHEAEAQLYSAQLALDDTTPELEDEAKAALERAESAVEAAARALLFVEADIANGKEVQETAAAAVMVMTRTVEGAAQEQLDGIRVAGLSLEQGVQYFVSIVAGDRAGNTATACTSGIIVDASPPSGGNVRVSAGTAIEVNGTLYVPAFPVLELSWAGFSDVDSGVATYELGIGSNGCGSTDLLPLHGVGLQTHYTAAVPVHAGVLNAVLRVRNAAGLSADYCSQAIHIDATAPTAGRVFDGIGVPHHYQQSTKRIDAHWEGFGDNESSIVKYEWAVGSGPRPSQQVMGWVDAGVENRASCPPLCAFDDGGNCPTDGQCIHTAAKPAVRAIAEIPGYCSRRMYRTEYECLNSRNAWTAKVPAVNAEPERPASCEPTGGCSELEDGVTYHVTVRAWNGVGEHVDSVSPGVTVDSVPPTPGQVWDGDGSVAKDLRYQASSDSFAAHCSGFGDVTSGVALYQWAIGTSPGGTEVQGFVHPGVRVDRCRGYGRPGWEWCGGACTPVRCGRRDFFAANLSLADGGTYFASVMAVDHAGNTVVKSSDGIVVDAVPPRVGAVLDGAGLQDASNQPLGPLAASSDEGDTIIHSIVTPDTALIHTAI